jgi:hypothetical protein
MNPVSSKAPSGALGKAPASPFVALFYGRRFDAAGGLRLLVCGGRDFDQRAVAYDILNRVHAKRRVVLVIHGAARGADTIARDWATIRGIRQRACPADWERLGRRAGPIRNQQMLDQEHPDGVLAFPGSTGTADMVARARRFGIPVWEPLLTH